MVRSLCGGHCCSSICCYLRRRRHPTSSSSTAAQCTYVEMLVTMAHNMCEAEPEEGEQKPWCPDDELPLEGDTMTVHLMDAHEEAGQPGTVYLFCKVRGALLTPLLACSASQPCSLHGPSFIPATGAAHAGQLSTPLL